MSSEDYKQQAENIYRLVLELKERDTKLRVFGANGHEYQIAPPLCEEEVSAFEKTHDISLPEDYRYFITHFFGSGTGPDYGLINLAEAAGDLAKPFVYAGDTPNFRNRKFEDAVISNWDGIIALSEQGCGGYNILIVRGKHSGEVWSAWENKFWRDHPSFNEWMTEWVNHGLGWLRNEDKTAKINVGMSFEEVKALTDDTWKVRHSAFTNQLEASSPFFGVRLTLSEEHRIIKKEER
jgi:hypothetical protein